MLNKVQNQAPADTRNWAEEIRDVCAGTSWTIEGLPDSLTADAAAGLCEDLLTQIEARKP